MSAEKNDFSDLEKNAELLRMVLPLMTRHSIPATPENYAVWYEYAAKSKPALMEEIDEAIKKKMPFSMEFNDRLYREHVAESDISNLLQIRQQVQRIIEEAGTSLTATGDSADRYGKSLESFSDSCAKSPSLKGLGNLLSTILLETRGMQETAQTMRRSFEDKSSEIQSLRKELEEVRRHATVDPLTGLENRGSLLVALEEAIEEAPNSRADLCIIMIDIDHFKRVNDSYGHLVGDKVISYVAGVLKKSIKGKDTACRFGGEEYLLLLPDTPFAGALKLAESIRRTVAEARLVRSGSREPLGQITISAGAARYQRGESPNELIERADQALYKSKNDGRNRVTAETDL
jgi:diguanylate cyclase